MIGFGVMWEDMVIVGILLLVAVGFYLTRGGGGVPGGLEDPALNQVAEYSPLGGYVPEGDTELEQAQEHRDC